MISKYISFPIFLVSLTIGLFFIYSIGPEVKTIQVYPNPQNYNKIQYKDSVNQCFEFKPVETNCPINPFSIKSIPIQK